MQEPRLPSNKKTAKRYRKLKRAAAKLWQVRLPVNQLENFKFEPLDVINEDPDILITLLEDEANIEESQLDD